MAMRKRFAIVGAGPAGTSTALHLLRQGVAPGDIVILDKARFPRPKLCGGAITYRGTVDLRTLGLAPTGGFETNGLSVYSPYGTLSMRGVSKEVVVNAEFGGVAQDPWGNTRMGFTVTGKIKRKDFGVVMPAEAGSALLGEDVNLSANVQFVKEKVMQPA